MTLRELLDALGMPTWMVQAGSDLERKLERELITTSNERIIGVCDDAKRIYLEV